MRLDKIAYDFYMSLTEPDEPDIRLATSMIKKYSTEMDRSVEDNVTQLQDMHRVYVDLTMTQCLGA
jgi:hypothetical protein